jgi:hypothetical protein
VKATARVMQEEDTQAEDYSFEEGEPYIGSEGCETKTFHWINSPHTDNENELWQWFFGVFYPNIPVLDSAAILAARNTVNV